MCGIVGAFGFIDNALLERMKAALVHRGPDQHGTYLDREVMLGHRRLSILDLSENGRQPMSDDQGHVVVLNGEIYNYKPLRHELENKGYRFESHSDTEVLVHGYAEWGHALPEKLDGEFAFAAWDDNRRELLLARDPLGVVPLYYAALPDGFFFASEPKALLEYEGLPASLNRRALDQYLTYQYAVAPDTLFEHIRKVRPGHALTVSKNRRIQERRYDHPDRTPFDGSLTEAAGRIQTLFAEAVQKRLQSDVPVGAYLSGGLDSSWIVAQMSQYCRPRTFSVAFGTQDDETPYVEQIVSHYDTQHVPLRVEPDRYDLLPQITWHLDAPPADIAALPTYLMAHATKAHASVVLTGDGGDEVFAGYTRYRRLLAAETLHKLPTHWTALTRPFLHQAPRRRLNEILKAPTRAGRVIAYAAAFSEEEKDAACLHTQRHAAADAEKQFPNGPFLNQMLAFDQAQLLPDDYLMKVNHSSMAHAVETRVPFLDTALVRFVNRLPGHMKADWHSTKIIQRRIMKAQGIPPTILHRKKHGFNVPTRAWLDHGLKEVANQCFETLDQRKLMRPGIGKNVLDHFAQSPAYYTRQFWTLLGLELWCRTYLDQDQPKPLKRL